MDELKPCPFCGKQPEYEKGTGVWCTNCDNGELWRWNTRPIEDSLRNEIVSLRSNLKVHGDVESALCAELEAAQKRIAEIERENEQLVALAELINQRINKKP